MAVFGSLLASRYAHQLADHVAGLPNQARVAAEGSLGGALSVAGGLGERARQLVDAAKDAWVSGFRLSLLVGAVVVAAAALIAHRYLPDQAHDFEANDLPTDGELGGADLASTWSRSTPDAVLTPLDGRDSA